MNTQNTFLACSLFFTLTACGGSGSSNMPEEEYVPQVSPKEAAWNKLSTEEKWASVGQGGDNYFVRLNTTVLGDHSLSFPEKDNLYKVKIEEQVIDIKNNNGISIVNSSLGQTEPSWKMFGGTGFSNNGQPSDRVGNLLSYIGSKHFTVGVVGLSGDNHHEYAFVEGNHTPINDIPVQDKVKYDVDVGYHIHSGNAFIQGQNHQTVNVDFGNHKVNAVFSLGSDEDAQNITLDADIKGNQFISADGAETRVKGGFFGDNAAEIGGIFHNQSVLGAFAGKQQN